VRILVTGGGGLIGFHIAKYYLSQGHDVIIMDNLERSQLLGHSVTEKRSRYNLDELHKLGAIDCRNPSGVFPRGESKSVFFCDVSKSTNWDYLSKEHANIDVIFHMAAQCGVPTSISDPRRDFDINTVGTFNMLEYARNYGSRVCYASSNKVYPLHTGWFKEGKRWIWSNPDHHRYGFPVTACDNQGSRTPYGASKFAGDILCQEYYHIYGVPTGVFRKSCIFGDHQFSFQDQGWLVHFIIATLKGDPIKIFGDGNQVRDVLWVEDLVRAYDAFATSDTIDHGVWNTGGGPQFTLSLNESLDIIEDLTGKRSEISYHDWRTSDQKCYTSDIRPLKTDLNWEPKVDPIKGIEKAVKWVESVLDLF